ncbi:uncharacterized protein LOC117955977 isoform X1 [Etheostoma cragini]|uniref:uncharacterized protein LOC117955977 isoform X1 n=1 Tax=Etheostoma cragini TaxID=417921 RepID=UPI00155F123A|nr:uncharacterized protein LOC117955977 isoform X1 [Etheostoma cragini]
MDRRKYRVLRRKSRLTLPNKGDTPVKPALSRQNQYRRLLPIKQYEALPEEPEVEEMNVPTVNPTPTALAYPLHTQTYFTPVHCKSVLCMRSPAFTENPSDKAVLPAMPANGKSGYRAKPDAIRGGEIPVSEQNMTLESITSSSMESDTTFSSDDDDDDDEGCHSTSTTSSSLPSPEIFRRESYVEKLTSFPIKEELLGLQSHIKNSTLLDVSHAESIHMYHPPDLSNIIDASVVLAGKNCVINQHRGPEAVTKTHTDSGKDSSLEICNLIKLYNVIMHQIMVLFFNPQSVEKPFKSKTPPKLTNRRPLLYKKKVCFKSPIIAENFKAKHTPGTKLTGPAEQIQSDTFRAGEIHSKKEASQLTVQSSLGKAKIFDFIDNSHRDAFFKRMRDRCVKLESAPLFPLTAPKDTEPSTL